MKSGKVYLIGAGPGDLGLITLKAVECLQKADVVVYDRLLDNSLLDFVPQDAERIYVGKTSSAHTMPQVEINGLLVQKAKEGNNVVRLKGGDPFVLGRGGEEAEELAKNGLTFEVVPGVTSAIAVPAYAGIPVTHRKLASSFAVITGHEDPTKPDSRIQWAKLATGIDTLIFLMGMQNLPEIIAKLVEHGRPVNTPAAVIKDGTRPQQKTVVGTLNNIVDRVEEDGMRPPAVIVVGDVVRLRETIRWFDNLPLFGKRILVTRARHQANTLSKMLYERGALPIGLPAIIIQNIPENRDLEKAILNLTQFQWVVFTSVNGVKAVFECLHALKLDSRALHGLKVGAIGPATVEALEQEGIKADYYPDVYTAKGLIEGFYDRNIAGKRFLLPRADIADEELTEGLKRLGATVVEIAVYRTSPDIEAVAKANDLILSNQIDVITFTSSSTVSNLVAALGKDDIPDGIKVACIGPKTADTAMKAGIRPDIIAGEHTIPGLVKAIEEFFRKVA